MPETGGLLGRWARLKAAANAPVATTHAGAADAAPPILKLPALESLGSNSDYRAFLQHGVVAELQQAALRRAWESDADIAGFRGMADYDWDFNAPSYGKLRASDNVAKLLQAVVSPQPALYEEPLPTAQPGDAPGPAVPVVIGEGPPAEVRMAALPEEPPCPAQHTLRRHGSALPC